MNFRFGKRRANFGKPGLNFRNDKTKNERLRWLAVPIEHKISLKEMDMVAPFNKGSLSAALYDKDGNRNSYVLPSIAIDRNPETISVSFFDNPDAIAIEIEGSKVTNIYILAGETKNEIFLKYKIKFDLPSDRDKRNRLINCMGEEIQISLKNKQQEAFAEDAPEDDAQEDMDSSGKEKVKKGADAEASIQ